MPTDKTESQKDNSSDKPVSNSQDKSVHGGSPNSGEKHAGSHQTTRQEQATKKPRTIDIKHIPKIDVIEGVEANRIASEANTISKISNNISRWAIAVNGLILAVTASLAIVAVHQYNAANDAAQTAKNTLTETKKFDSINIINQKKSNRYTDSLDSIKTRHDNLVFGYQKKSLRAQITAIQETQKEFDIENRPLVQVLDITIDPIKSGKNITLKYIIINNGKQPVKGITNKFKVVASFIFKKPIIDDKNWVIKNTNNYVLGQAIENFTWTGYDEITRNDSIEIMNGNIDTYLVGYYTFQNSVTFKKYVYQYEYKMNYLYLAGYNIEGITDTTFEIKPFGKNRKIK